MISFKTVNGGLLIDGLSAGTGGVLIRAILATDDTAKSTLANGAIDLRAAIKNTTNKAGCGTNANLLIIRNDGTTRFIFDAEGDAHADVNWTTFDDHDDIAVIESMETLLAPDLVHKQFGDVMKYDRSFFEMNGLLHDGRGRKDARDA